MIKHLDENAGQIFSDINHSSFFLAQSPKATEMIANINKQNVLKIISFYIANKMKIQHMGWEKIFANDADKGLISKIHIYLLIQFHKKTKTWAEDLTRHLCKEDIQMVNRHMKRCPISLNVQEIQMKTTMRCCLTTVRLAIIKKSTNNTRWRRCGAKGTLLHCWWVWSVSQYKHYGKQYGDSLGN